MYANANATLAKMSHQQSPTQKKNIHNGKGLYLATPKIR